MDDKIVSLPVSLIKVCKKCGGNMDFYGDPKADTLVVVFIVCDDCAKKV